MSSRAGSRRRPDPRINVQSVRCASGTATPISWWSSGSSNGGTLILHRRPPPLRCRASNTNREVALARRQGFNAKGSGVAGYRLLCLTVISSKSDPDNARDLGVFQGPEHHRAILQRGWRSTALSEKLDPEELRSLLHAYRILCGDVIARCDGFVARYVGDGILTYFGWPSAHEDDAERAVRAALEIVHTVERASSTKDLAVRIGIATGPVVYAPNRCSRLRHA
jgi:Adenylate and Guanylate cyclase catalytic domain